MSPVRLLAILEAESLTGPAKNLLQFAQLARSGLFNPGFDVVMAVFVRDGRRNALLEIAPRAGVRVAVLTEQRRFDYSVLRTLRELVEKIAPDLIETHAVKSHCLIRLAGLHRRVPWVAFHHGYTSPDWRMRLYNLLDYWSLHAASCVLTVCAPFRNELIRRRVPPQRIEVVHNTIDPNWGTRECSLEVVSTLRAKLGIEASKKIVIAVGRLSREKDHINLLRAFRIMVSARPQLPVCLLIVGEGPERPKIEWATRTLGLNGVVTLTGYVPDPVPLYSIADLAVLPSRSEGSPNALLEAMATRVPVVATAVGGIPEILTNGENGLLVAPDNPCELAEAMTILLMDGHLRHQIAARAYEHMIARFSPQARAKTLARIYLRLLGRDAEALAVESLP